MSYFRENIEAIAGYMPGFQPRDANVVKLNTNENPYAPSPKVTEAVNGISGAQLRRYPQPMGDAFRTAAAEVLGVLPGNIMCTNGGDDLLTICLRAFCDERRAVAYPGPTYSLYPVLADLQNCRAIEVAFDSEFGLPVEQLAQSGASLVIVCNPNAPTGSFVEPEILGDLADELKSRAVLLIDEAYVDFSRGNCLELVKNRQNVIVLRSMSKGYSLAGIRFGYAVASEELIGGLAKVKDSYNVDVVAISAATAAIKDQGYFRDNIEKVKLERARLTGILRELGFSVPDSEANFVLAKCGDCNADKLYKKLAALGIYVRYFDLPSLADKLRITIGTREQNDKLISGLKEIMR